MSASESLLFPVQNSAPKPFPPCRLDTPSSTVQSVPTDYRSFKLRGSAAEEFQAVYETYASLDKHFSIERLSECRSGAWFKRHRATGLVRVSAKSCHVRFCPLCSAARVATIRANVQSWLSSACYPKFVTLTLRHSPASLRSQLQRLYDSFRELRRLTLFKNSAFGGIWFFECKRGKDGMWHPHLHLVIEGKYIKKSELSRQWERVTSDSPIVDIRSVKNPQQVSEYVAKYATKPCELRFLNLDDRQMLLYSLEKRRLCGTWGTAKKQRLTAKPEYVSKDWETIGSWSSVIGQREHDEFAAAIYHAWKTNEPLAEGISVKYLDDLIDNREPDYSPPLTATDQFKLF